MGYLEAQMLKVDGVKQSLQMLGNSVDCPPVINRGLPGVIEAIGQLQDKLHGLKMALTHTNLPPKIFLDNR
jgi:hypothetical protein